MLNSTRVSDASAAFLAITGMLLLFASEEMLPNVVTGFPPAVAWIGVALLAARQAKVKGDRLFFRHRRFDFARGINFRAIDL